MNLFMPPTSVLKKFSNLKQQSFSLEAAPVTSEVHFAFIGFDVGSVKTASEKALKNNRSKEVAQ